MAESYQNTTVLWLGERLRLIFLISELLSVGTTSCLFLRDTMYQNIKESNMPKCTANRRCAQHLELTHTGYGRKQGCTHYCKVCGWGYWTHKIKPTNKQIEEAKKINPKAVAHDLTYYIVKPQPKVKWGTGVDAQMIDFFGGSKRPYWLNDKLKRIWRAKYIKKYPNSIFAKEIEKAKDGDPSS